LSWSSCTVKQNVGQDRKKKEYLIGFQSLHKKEAIVGPVYAGPSDTAYHLFSPGIY